MRGRGGGGRRTTNGLPVVKGTSACSASPVMCMHVCLLGGGKRPGLGRGAQRPQRGGGGGARQQRSRAPTTGALHQQIARRALGLLCAPYRMGLSPYRPVVFCCVSPSLHLGPWPVDDSPAAYGPDSASAASRAPTARTACWCLPPEISQQGRGGARMIVGRGQAAACPGMYVHVCGVVRGCSINHQPS